MIRKLLIVFASGLVLSILCISGAWVIGGQELVTHFRDHKGGWKFKFDPDDNGPRTTRTLAFDGSRILSIDGPVDLRFTRGAKSELTVEGPQSVVNRLLWRDGKLSLDGSDNWSGGGLEVTITAPTLAGLELSGASDVDLADLDQPEFTLEASGAADVSASGKVRKLKISTSGAGDLDFEKVAVEDASVQIAGVGDVDLAATGAVSVSISGAGDVTLHRRPKVLNSSIGGMGSINHSYPGGE